VLALDSQWLMQIVIFASHFIVLSLPSVTSTASFTNSRYGTVR